MSNKQMQQHRNVQAQENDAGRYGYIGNTCSGIIVKIIRG